MRFPLRSLLFAALPLALTLAGSARADSLATGGPADNFAIKAYVSGLGDVTDFAWTPDGRMVITQKSGGVKVRTTTGTVVDAGSFPVNTASEQGLLGVVVHPSFGVGTNRTLFFYYSLAASAGGTELDRHRVVTIDLKDDNTLGTEKVILKDLRGPANHDGGGLAIGPDGKLYVGVGDTGCNSGTGPGATTPPANYFGTCLSNANGKVLRINLDGSIPTDNPIAAGASVTACGSGTACTAERTDPLTLAPSTAPRSEIWAWGFRNPWRFWFDPKTSNLWVGDVGEVTYEEVDIVKKGKHYGWPWREAAHGWVNGQCQKITPNVGDCVDPIYECQHASTTATEDGDCEAITGGVIIDTCSWPTAYQGLYYFADNVHGTMWTLQPNAARDGVVAHSRKDFGNITGGSVPVSMHQGPDGNLYVAALPGRVVQIAPKTPIACGGDAGTDTGPATDTGAGVDGSAGDSGVSDSPTTGDTFTPPTSEDSGTISGPDGSTPDDGSVNGAAPTDSSGGCGCVVTGAEASSVGALASLAALGAMLMRRRRGRSSRS